MKKLEDRFINETVSLDHVMPDGSSTLADLIADADRNVKDVRN